MNPFILSIVFRDQEGLWEIFRWLILVKEVLFVIVYDEEMLSFSCQEADARNAIDLKIKWFEVESNFKTEELKGNQRG